MSPTRITPAHHATIPQWVEPRYRTVGGVALPRPPSPELPPLRRRAGALARRLLDAERGAELARLSPLRLRVRARRRRVRRLRARLLRGAARRRRGRPRAPLRPRHHDT